MSLRARSVQQLGRRCHIKTEGAWVQKQPSQLRWDEHLTEAPASGLRKVLLEPRRTGLAGANVYENRRLVCVLRAHSRENTSAVVP